MAIKQYQIELNAQKLYQKTNISKLEFQSLFLVSNSCYAAFIVEINF
jgi:hypothetical protein